MAQSYTDSLQKNRFIVVSVNQASGRVRVKSDTDACTDLSCSEQTLVVSDEGDKHRSPEAQSRRHREGRSSHRQHAADRRRPPRVGRTHQSRVVGGSP